MENIIPPVLQHLRPADIIRMAGLADASLGQEYCRIGVIRQTERQGTLLRGMVDLPQGSSSLSARSPLPEDALDSQDASERSFSVEVDVKDTRSWTSTCSCRLASFHVCAHGAALLSYWLVKPGSFTSLAQPPSQSPPAALTKGPERETKPATPLSSIFVVRYSESLSQIITQLGLSELRGIVREYDLPSTGLSREVLSEALISCLQQPEMVRRMVSTLEKTQRQLLATLILAGGLLSDDELRGIFERFSLGQHEQLQNILPVLQSKALLFRVNLSEEESSLRTHLSSALFDIGWYIPLEVRVALHVTVPLVPFDIDHPETRYTPLKVILASPYHVLADFFLVVRALDGYTLTSLDDWSPALPSERPRDTPSFARPSPGRENLMIPPPDGDPSEPLLAYLQDCLPHPVAFLRLAVRLLRGTGVVYRDPDGASVLRVLSNAQQLLLGDEYQKTLRDFFLYWLRQSSYGELQALQTQLRPLRVCCRSTALGVPLLRPGELESENREARQALLSLLAQTSSTHWFSLQAFARFVYRLNPLFLQKRQKLFSSPHWWLEMDGKVLSNPLQWSDWQRGELSYLSALVSGPLHWLGLCDLAFHNDDPVAFRLTPLASVLLRDEQNVLDLALDDVLPAIEIRDHDTLLVSCALEHRAALAILETFAEPIGVEQRALRYRITPEALGMALRRGMYPIPLLDLLRTAVQPGEGQDRSSLSVLLQRLEQWLANYGRVRIYTGVTLLEVADSATIRELSAITSLDESVVSTIRPELRLLFRAATSRIIDELKHRGQSPLVHDEEDFYGPE